MTLGDLIERTRVAFGGKTKEERELDELKKNLLSLQDLRTAERKKKDALDKLIKDKQAELAVTSLQQNQISLAKEILQLKKNLTEMQKTEDEISDKINTLDTLVHEKERVINDIKTETVIDVSAIEEAADLRAERLAEKKDIDKALGKLSSIGATEGETKEEVDALLSKAMSTETVTVKPAAPVVDPEIEAMIAAARAPTSAPVSAPAAEAGVSVAN